MDKQRTQHKIVEKSVKSIENHCKISSASNGVGMWCAYKTEIYADKKSLSKTRQAFMMTTGRSGEQ